MMQNGGWLIAIVYIVIGLYLVNFAFGFYVVPKALSSLDKFIIGIGGVLLVIGSFKFFKRQPNYPY